MKTKWNRRLIVFLKQLALFFGLLVLVGYWQTRAMPRGRAPVIDVTGTNGQHFEIPNQQSKKITLIYFFAPWCGVCRVSIRNLDVIREWFPDVDAHAVALDYESTEDVVTFVREVGVQGSVAFGSPRVRDAWNILGYPSYVIIGRDQDVRAESIGYSTQLGMIARVLWAKIW